MTKWLVQFCLFIEYKSGIRDENERRKKGRSDENETRRVAGARLSGQTSDKMKMSGKKTI